MDMDTTEDYGFQAEDFVEDRRIKCACSFVLRVQTNVILGCVGCSMSIRICDTVNHPDLVRGRRRICEAWKRLAWRRS